MRRSAVGLCVILALGAIILSILQSAPPVIEAERAKDYIGQKATVCGKVVSARYAAASRGSPTFLNLDRPYPNHVFTVVIWGSDRAKFGEPEVDYKGERICVTGEIESYRGVPQIVLKKPEQMRVEKQ
jgi:DNA/RNA endonuclease YhcR with UshA esterase domain